MSLRQLTRRLGRCSLSGFWQGRCTLKPWNEVANSQVTPPDAQGHVWDSNGDYGFATFSNVTNPSIGLDSVYQKHVYSRLAPVEAQEGSGESSDGKGEAVITAAVFATLRPAAAAATQKDADSDKPQDMASAQRNIKERLVALETDLTADRVSSVIEGAPGFNLTEEPASGAAVTKKGYYSGVRDSHADENDLNLAAEAASSHADTSDAGLVRPEPAEATCAAQECGSAVLAVADVVQSGVGTCQDDATPPAAPWESLIEARSSAEAGIPAELLLLPPTGAHNPDIALGQLWALPEEAGNATGFHSSGGLSSYAAVQTSSDACEDKEILLASSLADAVGRSARQTSPRDVLSAKGSITGQPKGEAGSSTIAKEAPSQVQKGATSSKTSAEPVKATRAEAGAHEALSGGQAAASAGFAHLRSVRLNPRDSAAEMHAERAQPHTAQEEKFLQESRWRLSQLLDKGSMEAALEAPGGKDVLAVVGTVCGRPVFAYCLDSAAFVESFPSEHACSQISCLVDRAVLTGRPIFGIYSFGGALEPPRAEEAALPQRWGEVLLRQMDASGVIPQLSIIAGGEINSNDAAALLLSAADFTFFVRHQQEEHQPNSASAVRQFNPDRNSWSDLCLKVFGSSGRASRYTAVAASEAGRLAAFLHALLQNSLSLFGAVIRALARPVQAFCESACTSSPEGTASCKAHEAESAFQAAGGVLCGCCSEREALQRARELLMYLPASSTRPALKVACMDSEHRLCPALVAMAADLNRGMPIHPELLIKQISDGGYFCSLGPVGLGRRAVGFARLGSTAVGILAFPLHHSPGSLQLGSIPSKAARLVRFCDAFNIPVVTLLLPAPARRRQDVCISAKGKGAHALANLIFAFSEASVPKLTLCLGGKEFSAAAQCLRSDVVLAWSSHGVPCNASGALRIINPASTRAALCAKLAPLLRPRVVARPCRKHSLLPL